MKTLAHSLLVLVIYPAWAGDGYVYTAETVNQNMDQRRQETSLVQAWVEGENAKILFKQSSNAVAKQGTYLLTSDGGKTVYLVNPAEKTYMAWSMDQLMALAGALSKFANLTFTNTRVDQLEKSSAERMHGFDTTRYKYKTTYDMELNVMGLKKFSSVETISESWVTDRVTDAGMGLWLRKEPPATGNDELDELIRTEMQQVKGFPLKSRSKTITRHYNRKRTRVKDESVTISETVVGDWQREAIAGATFIIPDDYQLVSLPGSE